MTPSPRVPSSVIAIAALLSVAASAAPAQIIESTIARATESNRRNTEGDIVVLKDGTLFAVWSDFYGSDRDDASARISGARSNDGGKTWSDRFTIQENVGEQNVMSASLLRSKSADILLFYGVKNSPEDLHFFVRRSTDEAQSWGPSVPVNPEPGYYVMNNARVIQISNGRILAPMAFTEKVWTNNEAFRTIVYFSDDDGGIWRRGPSLLEAPKRGAMEPGLVEMQDGRILQIIRTQLGMIWHSYSSDRGETWAKAEPWTIAAPEAPSTVLRLPRGSELLLIYNPNVDLDAGHLGPRTPLSASISRDGGKSWSKPKNIESHPDQTYAYVSATIHGDRVLLTYYVAKDRLYDLRFKSIPVNWFRQR